MSRVVHFEIPAQNPDQACKFYASAFGWKITKWEGPLEYYLVTTGEKDTPGIDGAIYKPGDEGINGVVNTIEIDNLEESIEKVKANGGEVITPKQHIPGVGWFVNAKDPEGVVFGMMQPEPMAAM